MCLGGGGRVKIVMIPKMKIMETKAVGDRSFFFQIDTKNIDCWIVFLFVCTSFLKQSTKIRKYISMIFQTRK